MKLSKNLTLNECLRSGVAERLGIDNVPDDEWVIENLRQVAERIFQPCRDHFGSPLYVSSGYRSPELNRAIGGSKRSQHIQGRALDLDADVFGGFSNAELFHYIKENLEFDQMVWEFGDGDNPSWVHVSYVHDGPNRKRCMEAYRDTDGKTAYKVIFD